MNFDLSSEQLILRETLSRYFGETFPKNMTIADRESKSAMLWTDVAERLGIIGALLPQELDGVGGGAAESLILMEAFGEGLSLPPLLDTLVSGSLLIPRMDGVRRAELARRMLAGQLRLAVALGEPQSRYNNAHVTTRARRHGDNYFIDGQKAVVIGAPEATDLIVSARTGGDERDAEGISLFLVPRDNAGLNARDYRTIDGRQASELYFESITVPATCRIGEEGEAHTLIELLVDHLAAAVCAESCGAMRAAIELTKSYLADREQFGQPLAAFQVIQHRIVNMMVDLEKALSMAVMAYFQIATEPDERMRSVSAAKVAISEAGLAVGKEAVQLHGAIGTTDDATISHYFRRLVVNAMRFGDADYHLDRFMQLQNRTKGALV